MKDKLTNYKPQKRNANKHTPRGMGVLEKSIQSDGWIGAITVAADGETFDGSARIEVGVATGFEDAIVVESDGTRPIIHRRVDIATADDPRARRLGIAANRVAQLNLDFDIDELLASVADGVDLEGLFRQDELDALLQAAHGQDEATGEDVGAKADKAAELKEQWGTRVGQVWSLGEHRIAIGDCTDRATVEAVMRGERAQACITDPPYGTASKSKVQKRGERIETFDIEWDQEAPTGWVPILLDYLDEGAGVISFWENAGITTLWRLFKDNGIKPLHTVYWKKTTVPQPRPNFCSSIESAVFARKPGKVLCWNGGGATPNVFEASRAAGHERTPHETQKPLALFSWLVELITNQAFVVYEPFSGSGTTLIACEKLNRKARCVELDEGYAAVSIHRWYEMTGKEPRLIT